jgi:hypothetical protein
MALLAAQLAQAAVFVQMAALGILVFSIKVLGETSRNYERFLRAHVRTAATAASTSPCKIFQAAVTFFFMREWEEDEQAGGNMMTTHLDNDDQVSEGTIRKLVHRAFPFRLFPEMEESDFDNYAEAAFCELGGAVDDSGNQCDSINLLEWCETALCGDVVDYIAAKNIFNPRLPRAPLLTTPSGLLEKKFGDNVKSYKEAKVKGIEGHKRVSQVDKSKKMALAGVAGGLAAGGAAAKMGMGMGKMAGGMGMGATKMLGGGLMSGAKAGLGGVTKAGSLIKGEKTSTGADA